MFSKTPSPFVKHALIAYVVELPHHAQLCKIEAGDATLPCNIGLSTGRSENLWWKKREGFS